MNGTRRAGPTRAATSVELLLALAAERGVDPDALAAAAGIDRAALRAPDAEVTAAAELAVVRGLVAAVEDPGLGVAAGQLYHLTTYGIWGFALSSSPTPRALVGVAQRYLDLTYALTRITARLGDGEVVVTVDGDGLPSEVRAFLVDRDTTAVRTLQRELLDDAVELEVTLPRDPPDDPGPFHAAFGPSVRFDPSAPAARLRLRGVALDLPLPRADARTAALAAAQCEQLLQARRARAGVAGEVRRALSARVADPPTLDDLAASRHVTARTLRRQLSAEGTTYRGLLDEVRAALAADLLTVAELSVTAVAHRLGYADAPAFTKAFRRWTGTTPAAFRSGRGGATVA
ncbi:AraC family transcriptional regulator [Nitriliruptoraceae bacterium ZYF776]|nr:AraC family transcriptional regulator [Profundirhabdus halotolerans]